MELLDLVPRDSAAWHYDLIYRNWTHDPINGVAALGNARRDDLTFVRRRFWDRHPEALEMTESRFVIMPMNADPEDHRGKTLIFTPQPRLMFSYMAQPFIERPCGVHRTACLGPDVKMGKACDIEADAIVMHATLGDNVRIGPGVVIGSQGFGFATDHGNGNVVKFPQLGRVVIGNDVEIFAHATIARGALGDTVIGDMVKIDQLVHVAHGAQIGKGTLVIADAMIGGSTRIGRYCWIAPGTQVINKVTIGDFAMTGLGAVVTKDVERNALVVGVPARKLRDRFEEDDPILQL